MLQVKQQMKHQRERIPQLISDLIDRCLSPLYNHLASFDRLTGFGRLGKNSESSSKYDAERFNLQEIVEIYSKYSLQRRQRQARVGARGTEESKNSAEKGGLFPINAHSRAN